MGRMVESLPPSQKDSLHTGSYRGGLIGTDILLFVVLAGFREGSGGWLCIC